jgi:hypothetical protein
MHDTRICSEMGNFWIPEFGVGKRMNQSPKIMGMGCQDKEVLDEKSSST